MYVTILGGLGLGNNDDQLNNPTSIAFDSDGSMYVTDTGNNRIQKFMLNDIFNQKEDLNKE